MKRKHKSKVGTKIKVASHVRKVGRLPERAGTGRFVRKVKVGRGGQTTLF